MYTSELIQQILTSESSKKAVQRVTHKYDEAPIMLNLFNAIGLTMDKYIAACEDLQNQVLPQTATWSIPWWERAYGIAVSDDSITDEDSLADRRTAIIQKMKVRGALTPQYFAELISQAVFGAEIVIEENTGTRKFTVYLSGPQNDAIESAVRSAIDKYKPAHLCYEIIYQNTTETQLYVGGIVTQYGEITLTEV